MKKIRWGIVGPGNIAGRFARAVKNVACAELAAVASRDGNRGAAFAETHEIPHVFEGYAEMAASDAVDAVYIATPHPFHKPCAELFLNAGKHVLCEKPMAYNTKLAEEMKAEADKAGKLLMVGFVLRFSPENDMVKSFIDSGVLGEIYYSKATYLRRHGNPGGWFANKALSGGGPVIDLGVHVIDQTRFLMGSPKPVSVYATTSDRMSGRKLKADIEWRASASDEQVCDVEDFGVALIRYDNGASTLLETSYEVNFKVSHRHSGAADSHQGSNKSFHSFPILSNSSKSAYPLKLGGRPSL